MKRKNLINTKLLKISIILLISLIIIIGFIGIYGNKLNKLSNLLPEYNFTTDIVGAREFDLVVDDSEEEKKVYVDENNNIVGIAKEDEEGKVSEVDGYSIKALTVKANEVDVLNRENYEKTKKIIENRIKNLGIVDYKIRLDNQTGNMVLELKQDKNTDINYNLITTLGKFEIKDYQNGIVLMNNDDVVNTNVISNQSVTGKYNIYIQVNFDEEGTKKIKEISKKYVATNSENGEENIDYIAVELDDSALYTTYFNEEWNVNYIYIPVAEEISDETELKEVYDYANKISNTINSGKLPIEYTLRIDNFVKSEITDLQIKIFKYSILGVLVIILIVLTILFRVKGFVIGFSNIGFASILLLVLRYLNVEIAISGVVSLIASIIINTIFSIMILINNKKDEKSFNDTFKKYNSLIFPIIILSLIYTILTKNISIISFGMILFWGIIIFEIYNYLVVKILIEK